MAATDPSAFGDWRDIEIRIEWCNKRIGAHLKNDAQAKAATELIGVGPVTASALVATVGDFHQFNSCLTRQADCAWCRRVMPGAS